MIQNHLSLHQQKLLKNQSLHLNLNLKQNQKKEPAPVEEEGVVEIGRRNRTREDGTKYWEVEFSDGSMEIEEDSDV